MGDLRLGKNGKLNTGNLQGGVKKNEAIKKDKNLEAIFDSVDKNKDGVLDKDEMTQFKQDILKQAGNDKLSKREAGKYLKGQNLKHLDKKELFEFLDVLSQSGEDIENSSCLTDKNGKKTILIQYKDGSVETIKPDGTREVETKGQNGERIVNTYKKDAKNPTTVTTITPEGVKETQKFDDNNRLVSTVLIDENGTKTTTNFDENKKVTDSTTVYKGGNPVEVVTFDENQKPEALTVKDGSTIQEYSFSENGEPILDVKKENVGIPAKEKTTTYTYNEDGTVTEHVQTANGKSVINRKEDGSYTETIQNGNDKTETAFDKDGNKLSQTKTVNGETYTVQYDGKGNTLVTVQNGESIEMLAKKFGCTPEEIINANKDSGKVKGGKNNKYFLVGDEVKIPREVDADHKGLQGRVGREEAIQGYVDFMEAKRLKEEEEARLQEEQATQEVPEENKPSTEDLKAKQQEANAIAKGLYSTCQRQRMRTVDSADFQAELKKVNSENASMVLSQFNAESPDLTYVDMICSQQFSSEAKRKDALTHVMDALAEEARAKGVPEAEIAQYTKAFKISMNAEFKKIGFIDPKKMEANMKALHGLVLAKNVDAVEMTDAEAIDSLKETAQGEYDNAKSQFDKARKDESWTARTGDTVLGWFGCITKEDMEGKLANYKGDIEKLQNCKTEAEFKKAYEEVFGIKFDSKKIAAYESAKAEFGLASSYKGNVDTLQQLYTDARGLDYEAYKAKVAEVLPNFKPEDIDEIVNNMSESYMKEHPHSDKKDVLRHFIDQYKQEQVKLYDEITKGRSLEQMQSEVDSVRQSAFGTKDIVNDVIKYNQNQETTGMVVEMAGEIAATAALQAIPGLGQMAAARLAVSAARWGTRGAKLLNIATKASNTLGKVNTAINSTKTARMAANTGAAFVGTTAVDLSNGKSVKEALHKGLQNAAFAGAGAMASELAPVIAKTYGVSGKVASEIAEEITEAALDVSSSAVISVAMIGDYTSDDAFMDLATGIIMNRLGKVGMKDAGKKQNNAPAQNTPAPAPAPVSTKPQSQTPVIDKASSQGQATPASVKVGDKKAQQIKEEIDNVVSNPDVAGEDLAQVRQEVGGLQNREVRREAERKIDNAADNLTPEEKAKFEAAKKANAEQNVNHIFEKHSELNSSDTRVLNEYIQNADDVEVLNKLKQQLADKEHTYGGVTANYDKLREAIDKKVAELQPTPVKTNAEQHENVVKMLNEKATTGKGLNENEFKELTAYISTIDNASDLKEIKGLLGGKKMTSAQKKALKEALATKTEALKSTPTPAKVDTPSNTKGFSDSELNELYKKAFPNVKVPTDSNVDAMVFLNDLDVEIASQFDAHGIAKISITDQLKQLNELLTKGIDPNRNFYTAPLASRESVGAGLGTGAGHAYRDGSFIIVSEKGKSLADGGVKTVIVNDAYYSIIDDLKAKFPDVEFVKAEDAAKHFNTKYAETPTTPKADTPEIKAEVEVEPEVDVTPEVEVITAKVETPEVEIKAEVEPKVAPAKADTPKTENKADTPAPVKATLDPAEIKRQNLKAEQDKLADLRAKYPVAQETMTINGEKRLVNIFQGSRSGSNTGYWIQDVKTGELSYIKYPPKGKNFTNRSIEEQLYGQAAQAKTEALSADLYRAAGLPSPEIEIVRDANGNVGIKSKFLGKLDNPTMDDLSAVREGFAVDCWLANWDALKTGNVQMQAGQAIRADVGGSLNYRARGARKGTAFGENVNELTSFFNPKNSWSLPYIKNMTKDELINSLKRVTTIDDATIASIIKKAEANGISNPNFLREMLIERRNYMERFQKLCETTPQLPNESIADYVQRIQDATPKTTYDIGGKSFDDIPISARIYGDLNDLDAMDLERINKSVKMSELYTPSQKRIFEASYQALENSKGAKIRHNTNNMLTENNLLHVTNPDSLDGILNGGLVSREYSGRVAARRSDGDPGSMTPMCADVWEVQDNYTIGDYFTRPHSKWNNGEKNFLPNDPTDYGIVLVFDKSSIDKTLLDNSFKVSDKTSPLYQDGNMGGYDSYTSHRAVPVGLPSNAIDRILLSPEYYGAAKIDEIYAQIQKSGLDIDIYDLHGNLLRGKGSADAAKPSAPNSAKADTPAPKQEPEVHYITNEERMQLSQIGQNINRAKNADDLAKAQAWLDKMPDCSQKEHLQRQLNEKKKDFNLTPTSVATPKKVADVSRNKSTVKVETSNQKLDWDIDPNPSNNNGFKRNINAKTDIGTVKSNEIAIECNFTGYSHIAGPVTKDLNADFRNAVRNTQEYSVYHPEKNITAIGCKMNDSFRRPGIFNILIKGQVSETDATGLMDHLRSKNLIPKESGDDYHALAVTARKIQEETANYFNNLNAKNADSPVEVKIADEPIEVEVVKHYGEWNVQLTHADKVILDTVEDSFEKLRKQLNLELEDYAFSPLFQNNPMENMQALQKCDEFKSMLNQVPDCDKKLELKNKLQAMRNKLEQPNTPLYQQTDNFGYPDYNMQYPYYQNDIDMMNGIIGLDMLDDMNNGF